MSKHRTMQYYKKVVVKTKKTVQSISSKYYQPSRNAWRISESCFFKKKQLKLLFSHIVVVSQSVEVA